MRLEKAGKVVLADLLVSPEQQQLLAGHVKTNLRDAETDEDPLPSQGNRETKGAKFSSQMLSRFSWPAR